MRYDPDQKARTRERVLSEAAAAIRAYGADRVGVASVMGRCGLTHGGFYAHFASRDDLLAAAIDFMFGALDTAFFANADHMDPHAVLARYVDHCLSRSQTESDRQCPLLILASEHLHLPTEARSRLIVAFDRIKRRVRSLLERSGIDGASARTDSAMAELVGAAGLARVCLDDDAADRLIASARRSVRSKLGLAYEDEVEPA